MNSADIHYFYVASLSWRDKFHARYTELSCSLLIDWAVPP